MPDDYIGAARRAGVVVRDAFPELRTTLQRLVEQQVMVGVPADQALRQPDPGEKVAPNNAMLAYIHENGAPAANIPARPFLVPGIREAKDQIVNGLRKAGEMAMTPGVSKDQVDQRLHAVGLIGQEAVKKKIETGPFAPLAPATIAARKLKAKKRGAPSDEIKPLIDEGKMQGSINYVLRKRGGQKIETP